MKTEELQKELMPVVDGLLMKSDVEAPFEWFHRELKPGQQFSPEAVTEWSGKASGMDVETRELDDFFQEMGGVGAGEFNSFDQVPQELWDAMEKKMRGKDQ